MNIWNEFDLEALEIRDKIIILTEKFDFKNGKNIKDYSKKLNRFIERKLKVESNLLIKKNVFMTISGIAILNQKIYK